MKSIRAVKQLTGVFAGAVLMGLATFVHADAPTPNPQSLTALIKALDQPDDPQAKAMRQKISDGPADLKRERAAAEKEGILGTAAQTVPADQNSAALFDQWHTLMVQQKAFLPEYAETLSNKYFGNGLI